MLLNGFCRFKDLRRAVINEPSLHAGEGIGVSAGGLGFLALRFRSNSGRRLPVLEPRPDFLFYGLI
jgi:hypothetical protein